MSTSLPHTPSWMQTKSPSGASPATNELVVEATIGTPAPVHATDVVSPISTSSLFVNSSNVDIDHHVPQVDLMEEQFFLMLKQQQEQFRMKFSEWKRSLSSSTTLHSSGRAETPVAAISQTGPTQGTPNTLSRVSTVEPAEPCAQGSLTEGGVGTSEKQNPASGHSMSHSIPEGTFSALRNQPPLIRADEFTSTTASGQHGLLTQPSGREPFDRWPDAGRIECRTNDGQHIVTIGA